MKIYRKLSPPWIGNVISLFCKKLFLLLPWLLYLCIQCIFDIFIALAFLVRKVSVENSPPSSSWSNTFPGFPFFLNRLGYFQLSTQAVLFVMPPPPLTAPGLPILVVPAAAVIIEESLNSLI